MPVAEGDSWIPTGASDPRLEEVDISGTSWSPGALHGIVGLIAVLPLGTGTGGFVPELTDLDASSSSFTVNVRARDLHSEVPGSRTSNALAAIRAAFGSNVTQTAEILQVKRQTIYAWLANKTTPQQAKRARLEQVLNLAHQWRQVSNGSLRAHLHETVSGSKTLLHLLSEELLPVSEIEQYFTTTAKTQPVRRSAREWAAEMGIGMPTEEEQQRAVDRETGKRASPE